MVRYLVLRTLIFTGCLAATWLLGLRDREEQLLAVVIAAGFVGTALQGVVAPMLTRAFAAAATTTAARR